MLCPTRGTRNAVKCFILSTFYRYAILEYLKCTSFITTIYLVIQSPGDRTLIFDLPVDFFYLTKWPCPKERICISLIKIGQKSTNTITSDFGVYFLKYKRISDSHLQLAPSEKRVSKKPVLVRCIIRRWVGIFYFIGIVEPYYKKAKICPNAGSGPYSQVFAEAR